MKSKYSVPIGLLSLKQVLLFFLFLSVNLDATSARPIEEIQIFHQKGMALFIDLQKQNKLSDKAALQHLFKILHDESLALTEKCDDKKASSLMYLQQLRRDIASLKKTIKLKRKNHENTKREQQFADLLNQLQKFLKKYRLQIEVVGYHSTITSEWRDAFDLVDQGKDILPLLPLKGIEKSGLRGLKVLIRKTEHMLSKINEYEDRLHADWVDLKLANYVFKIELIRLRNAAIFHPLYRGTSMKSNYPR